MSTPDFEFLSFLVSVVAIIISATALIRSRKTHDKFLELEKIHADLSARQIEEIEKSTEASSKANMEVEIRSGSVILTNTGFAAASEVNLLFENEDDKCFTRGEFEVLPFPLINPLGELRLSAAYDTIDAPQVISLVITWVNEDSTSGSKKVVLRNN